MRHSFARLTYCAFLTIAGDVYTATLEFANYTVQDQAFCESHVLHRNAERLELSWYSSHFLGTTTVTI